MVSYVFLLTANFFFVRNGHLIVLLVSKALYLREVSGFVLF